MSLTLPHAQHCYEFVWINDALYSRKESLESLDQNDQLPVHTGTKTQQQMNSLKTEFSCNVLIF